MRLRGTHPIDNVLGPGFGPSFFTKEWEQVRESARGYDADISGPMLPAADLNRLTFDPATGILEAEKLEPGSGGWLDLGGAPGTFVAARRA